MTEIRLDSLILKKGLAGSRVQARDMILEKRIMVNSRVISSPGKKVDIHSEISLSGSDSPFYVSRSARKLSHFLQSSQVDPAGMTALDAGSSTGGFTEVLLGLGVEKIYSIDVGSNQLHERLRNDRRVIVMENTDIRSIDSLPDRIGLAVVDLSFISIKKVIHVIINLLADNGIIIALIKPQFESERSLITKKGILPVRYHPELLESLNYYFSSLLKVERVEQSIIKGKSGNREYFFLLKK